jgi:uncharacterized membrane protein
MPKENRPGARKPSSNMNGAKAGGTARADKATTNKSSLGTGQSDQMATPTPPTSPAPKRAAGSSGSKQRIGGTAVPGAKSTQPKEITSKNPQQQQVESYNRTMRRRMEQMGTTPTNTQANALEQRRKRLEKRDKRREERREEVRKVAATGPRSILLGNKNTYFLIAVAILIIIIIVLATLFNHHIL